MQRTDDSHRGQVQRLFGDTATLRASLGTQRRPGRVEIRVGSRLIGVGRTFDKALEMAQKLAAADASGS